MKAYCVKCRGMRDMKNEKEVKMKTGRKAMKGTCVKCGTGMYKILPGSPAKATKKK
ncbi:MAG: DUF5679 domain-containing protein [candidate division WOR-3 bacterium]|nr:DUF5679 domain-containing protein [candidate division WOR-3 bacterium]MDH5684439.1 DUF5679 domain-containing protein [candidate division WOR-3 bacterium]